MKRTRLHRTTELRTVSQLERRAPLRAVSELGRSEAQPKRKPISPATPEQKAKVSGLACIAADAGPCMGPIDPMHLIDRSLAPSTGDDIRAVVPGCRRHHRQYDDHDLDLSPYLEPRWRTEVAWAIEAVGLFQALWRITGKRWQPKEESP